MRTDSRNGVLLDSAPKAPGDERDDLFRMEPLALRPAAAAKAIGVSRRVLCSMTADRSLGLPHVRIGGKLILYPVRELREWLAARLERPR